MAVAVVVAVVVVVVVATMAAMAAVAAVVAVVAVVAVAGQAVKAGQVSARAPVVQAREPARARAPVPAQVPARRQALAHQPRRRLRPHRPPWRRRTGWISPPGARGGGIRSCSQLLREMFNVQSRRSTQASWWCQNHAGSKRAMASSPMSALTCARTKRSSVYAVPYSCASMALDSLAALNA